MSSTRFERRAHDRRDLSRPCKVFLKDALRYAPGTTRNVSDGGALLEVGPSRPLSPGDPVDLLISWTGQAVVRAESMAPARVVRVIESGHDRQLVALSFEKAAAAAAA
ncbi:MAG: PilZ domain-containing protein [Phycisphaerales bacterium JB039]